MDEAAAEQFARSWYDAWNSNDLERILSLYADDLELTSPLVSVLTGAAEGKLVGKAAVQGYFAAGLERYPGLRFQPRGLFVGVDSLVLHYVSANGRLAAEVVVLNEEGKISRYSAHYASV